MSEPTPSAIPPIASASALIDALGGTKAVAGLCGVGDSAVSMWRSNGIAHRHRLPLSRLAVERGLVLGEQAFDPARARAA